MTTTTLESRAHAAGALALRVRRHVLQMTSRSRASHVGGAFSMVDLLAALYGGWLRIDPSDPSNPTRDRFVLSKGHACSALYATLAETGFFPIPVLDTFYQDGSLLAGHATASGIPGVDVSTGALGHGLAIACGMALAGKRAGGYRVAAILSDGECDEGSTWEAALFAPHHRLDNLLVIVDYNKIQSLGNVADVLNLEPFGAKWASFGWDVREIDGHDPLAIEEALAAVPFSEGRPSCLIAHTIKGKGVSFMERELLWHYRAPDAEELAKALQELADRP